MKKIENNFAVTGFVGKDAEIRQFTTASVARFSLAIGRIEKNDEDNNRVSAFINVEAWRKNENAESFDKLTKGAMLRRRRKLQRRRPSEPSSSLCKADFLNKGKRKELDFIRLFTIKHFRLCFTHTLSDASARIAKSSQERTEHSWRLT